MNARNVKLFVLTVVALSATAKAAQTGATAETLKKGPPPTVAVLGFESNLTQPDKAGRIIAEVLSARLAALDEIRVVERRDIEKILKEQKMSLTGLIPSDRAVKAGKLLGAQLLVTGRVTNIGSTLLVVCRVISSETSELKGFVLILPVKTSFGELVDKSGAKLAGSLPGFAKHLIPPARRGPGDVAMLKRLVAGKRAGRVAVVVPEQHLGPPALDPAVETELRMLLTKAGIPVVVVDPATVKEIAKGVKDAEAFARLRKQLGKTRYLIRGEAISEMGGRFEGLVVGLARVEIQVLDLKTARVLLAERYTARAPDLAEHLAAKTALQKAARAIARKVLPKLIEHFPPAARSDASREPPGTTTEAKGR